jgi:hypothetical protein
MVVLGVLPGISSLAYSVVSFPEGGAGTVVDCDLLHHQTTERSSWGLSKSSRVHALVLGIVVERHPAAAIAIGPQADPHESAQNAAAVRVVLESLGFAFRAKLVHLLEDSDVYATLDSRYGGELDVGERNLRRAVRCALTHQVPSRNRRIVLATAAAIAAEHLVRSGA